LSIALSRAAAFVTRLYIFCVCFFLAIAPQGKFFGVLYPGTVIKQKASHICEFELVL